MVNTGPTKNPSHRPPWFDDPSEMQPLIDNYFDACDKGEVVQIARRGGAIDVVKTTPYTVPGLAHALGFTSRQSIWDYKQKENFTYTIGLALVKIQTQRVEKGLTGEQDARFAMFDLVNNFNYASKREEIKIDHHITYTDQELDARLLALESKVKAAQLDAPTIVDADHLITNASEVDAIEQDD